MSEEQENDQLALVDDDDENDGFSLEDYGISIIPNDFNVATLADYIKRGEIFNPGFSKTICLGY